LWATISGADMRRATLPLGRRPHGRGFGVNRGTNGIAFGLRSCAELNVLDIPATTAWLESAWAADAVAFARVLAIGDPSWHTEAMSLAGGWLVLCGRGLYVNRALAVGVDRPLRHADIDLVEARSAAVGVGATFEVTSITNPASTAVLTERGYVHQASADTTALVHSLDHPIDIAIPRDIEVEPVSQRSLAEWKEVSALGWGHVTPDARRAADTFADAAHQVDGDGMVIAVDAADRRPLGCASITINGDLATLGGMSTIPAERRRGVQSALIRFRLLHAQQHGCTLAASTTVTGGESERNVIRLGFQPVHSKQAWLHQ
jgi:GNAT superfamily N-acetyltransferase